MIRTIVVFEKEEERIKISEMLEKNGIRVRFICRTGSEAIRSINKMGGGVVVCGFKFPDMSAEELMYELKGKASFLMVAKPARLDMCEDEDAFKLAIPVRGAELSGAVNMLIQLDQQKSRKTIPKRSEDEKLMILRAKEIIMKNNDFSEEEAYSFLQRKSMETASKMSEIAKKIIQEFDENR